MTELAKGSTINIYGIHSGVVREDSEDRYLGGSNDFITSIGSVKNELPITPYKGYWNGVKKEHIISEGDRKVTAEGRDVSGRQIAKMTGKYYNETTNMLYDHGSSANAPYMSCSWAEVTAEGATFYQCHKGIWSIEAKEGATKKDGGIDPKNITLVYEACETIYEYDLHELGYKQYDEATDAWVLVPSGTMEPLKMLRKDVSKADYQTVKNDWFSAIQLPTAVNANALSLVSSSPADGETDVAASATPVLTFSNTIAKYSAILLEGSTSKSFTYSKDADYKVFTNVPVSNLTAGETYTLTYDVVDEFGQTLKGAITFDVAA